MNSGDAPTDRGPPPRWPSLFPRVMPLENGDRLPRCEFEKRYLARPDIKKAELIEGVVHMPSPVRATHAEKHGDLLAWLRVYGASTPGVAVLDNATVRLDPRQRADGILRSRTFPGLHPAADALLAGDFAGVLAELGSGLDTPEHAAFVALLSKEPLP